jgi:hypothetical protein
VSREAALLTAGGDKTLQLELEWGTAAATNTPKEAPPEKPKAKEAGDNTAGAKPPPEPKTALDAAGAKPPHEPKTALDAAGAKPPPEPKTALDAAGAKPPPEPKTALDAAGVTPQLLVCDCFHISVRMFCRRAFVPSSFGCYLSAPSAAASACG